MSAPVTPPTALEPAPGILQIEPYVGGRSDAPGAARVFKLSANETPLGPSAKARAAFAAAADTLHLYPDGDAAALRAAIATRFGLNADRIVCGNGSDELLHLLPQAYCQPGDEVLFSAHGFLVYKIAALAAGATPVTVPEPNRVFDVDETIARIGPRTRMVFIANPNNPTGTYISSAELKRLHAALPPSALLVIDAAYAEYVARNDYDDGLALAQTARNVVTTRTFSKIHGLAGLRIGWLYGPKDVADVLNRIRGPFNVSVPGQAAAIEAIRDTGHVADAAAFNARWLPWLIGEIRALGLQADDSVCNFTLIHFPDRDGKRAMDAFAFLRERGLILRPVGSYGFPNSLRLTVGTEEANRLVAAALKDFMAS